MAIVYNLIFLIFALIYLPVFLWGRKFHRGFVMRLGFLPRHLNLEHPIWIHAVSVGEAMAAKLLLEELRKAYPGKQFVISTVTATGNKIAKGIAGNNDFVCYLPLDFSFIVDAVIGRIKPEVFIILETEIWPNLIHSLFKRGIPAIIVNSRISDKSLRGYRLIKFFLKSTLNKVSLFCVQTITDAQRLIDLGAHPGRIRITGNMKFDLRPHSLNFDIADLKLKDEEKLWVCGSTHAGEEEIIFKVYKNLLGEFPYLRLLVAPRHPQRSGELARLAKSHGLDCCLISQLRVTSCDSLIRKVFILDTVGQLLSFYSIADIVFVGGSLVKKGGHNILEPASFGKPIIFGPQMFNFRDIADLFLKNQAALLACGERDLVDKLRGLLNNQAKINELGARGQGLIAQNRGATQRNLKAIEEIYTLDGLHARLSL